MDRAELGVDGNAAFALLGDDLQSGEAEFVEIETDAPWGTWEFDRMASIAATEAYRKLQKRLAPREFSYFLGPSHPKHC